MTSRSDETEVRAEVMRLHYLEGLSLRAIARRLHLGRRTVQRHLAKLPPTQKPAPVPRTSLLDPYDATIRALLKDTPELKTPQILERVRELGYSGGITILRDRVQGLRPKPKPESFLTLDFHPGEALQVDWADFGFALPGVPRRVCAFVAVLCYSRLLYIEFTVSQAMGTFLRCMDRALAFFGGVTTVDIFDNMKTVVLEHPRAGPVRFNPRFLAFCPMPTLVVASPSSLAPPPPPPPRAVSSGRSRLYATASGPVGASRIWPTSIFRLSLGVYRRSHCAVIQRG